MSNECGHEQKRDTRFVIFTGTAHEERLDVIAAQVQEKQIRKERLMREKRNKTVEDYYPFGHAGCGTPIRSESGRITDYQEKVSLKCVNFLTVIL